MTSSAPHQSGHLAATMTLITTVTTVRMCFWAVLGSVLRANTADWNPVNVVRPTLTKQRQVFRLPARLVPDPPLQPPVQHIVLV